MIATDINGNTLSANYDNVVKGDNREFLARILKNGVQVDCGIKRLEILKGSVGDTAQFGIGSVISNSLTAEVLDLNTNLKNEEIEIQIGLLTDESNDTWEWIRLGYFTISEVKKTINGAILTGYGNLVSHSTGNFTEPSVKSLYKIGLSLWNATGAEVIFDSNIDTSLVIEESMYGLTIYQAIQLVAQLIGGYAIDLPNGKIKFCTFNDSITAYANSGMMTSLPDMEEQDFTITGIQCIVSEATDDIPAIGYTQGTPINMSFNNSYMTQSLFNQLANNLIGYTYRPGFINLSLGDPRLEGNDVLQITNADSSVYVVPLHQVRHIYDGGFRTEIRASAATNLENNIGTISPLQQQKKDTDQNFVEVEKTIEELATGVQYFWYDTSGAHVSTINKAQYEASPGASVCLEVLITSTQIIFRRGARSGGTGTWSWTVYGIYANTGITLGDYASMTDSGIILGDINDTYYQLVLNPTQGLLLNGSPIIISEYATQEVVESTTTTRYCAGMLNGSSDELRFTVPLECIVPEGTSVNITFLRANIKAAGTNYFLDYAYTNGGIIFSGNTNYTITGQVVGTSMTVTISKSSTFKQSTATSYAVPAYSAVVVELTGFRWTKPAASRNAKKGNTEDTKEIEPPEVIEK